jgi:hypothetical protein
LLSDIILHYELPYSIPNFGSSDATW